MANKKKWWLQWQKPRWPAISQQLHSTQIPFRVLLLLILFCRKESFHIKTSISTCILISSDKERIERTTANLPLNQLTLPASKLDKMPQASARSASLHRQEMLAQEEKKKKKREGKRSRARPTLPSSFPSTIDSSVSVGDAKVKRRRLSLQRGPKLPPSSNASLKDGSNGNNNENEQPNSVKQGPTPYIQVSVYSIAQQYVLLLSTRFSFISFIVLVLWTFRFSRSAVATCLLPKRGQPKRRSQFSNFLMDLTLVWVSCFFLLPMRPIRNSMNNDSKKSCKKTKKRGKRQVGDWLRCIWSQRAIPLNTVLFRLAYLGRNGFVATRKRGAC